MFPLAPLLVALALHAVAPADGPPVGAEGFRLRAPSEDEWEVAPLEGGLDLGEEPWRPIDLDPEAPRDDGAEEGEDEEDPLTVDVEDQG